MVAAGFMLLGVLKAQALTGVLHAAFEANPHGSPQRRQLQSASEELARRAGSSLNARGLTKRQSILQAFLYSLASTRSAAMLELDR